MTDHPSAVLPRTPHRTVREEVAASQRGRLLVAMADVVGEKGFAAATVADVLAVAGVSRRSFYEHFADKEACFLAAYEHGCAVMAQEMRAAAESDRPWRGRVEAAIGRFLELLAAEPGFARAFLVEVWAAGPQAMARHAAVIEQFHAMLRALHEQARAERPEVVPVSDAIIRACTGGISRLCTLEVLAGRAESLPDLVPEVLRFGLPLLAGTDPQLAGEGR